MPRTSKPSNGGSAPGNGGSAPGNGGSAPAKPKRAPIRKPNGEIVADDLIARRAYEIYESRGGQHGADFDDWLEAERQIKAESQFQAGRAAPKQTERRKRA